jgi:crotonobetainyl-CoA:carnitine CoA-transferase CaiB-like acyl-CoA transferase
MATKYLASFGADVLKIEPPGGDPSRRWTPQADLEDLERSPWFLYLNTGKRSATLDLDDGEDAAMLRRLVDVSDVVVEDFRPGRLHELGIDVAELRRTRPELVVVSITPYGQDGPYAERAATALTMFAAGGAMWLTGEPYLEPVKNAGPQAFYQTGYHAFAATLVAVLGVRRNGVGRHIDISVQETVATMLEVNGPNGFNHGRDSYRCGNVLRSTWAIYPCRDGHIGVHALDRNLPALFRAIGQPELIEEYADPAARGRDNDILEATFYSWCADRTAQEIYEIGQRERAPFAYLPTMGELLEWPGLRARNFWEQLDHPVAGTMTYPGPPLRMRDGAHQLQRAPLLAEHQDHLEHWLDTSAPGSTAK